MNNKTNSKNFVEKVEKVLEDVDFFKDKNNPSIIYARYYILNNVEKLSSIDESEFKSYVRMVAMSYKYFKLSADDVVQYVKDYFTVVCIPPEIETNVRTAGNLNGTIEYALHDNNNNVVCVDENGWSIKQSSENHFLSFKHTLPQVEPVPANRSLFDLMKPYVNLSGDFFTLFIIWLVQIFSFSDHSAILLSADCGSGKTFLSRVVRAIVDPSRLDVTILPTKVSDLCTILTNSAFVSFDNISEIPKDISDILCTAITGASTTKRELYSTNSLSIFRMHNSIILNGIDVMPSESDLAERLILMKLPKINSNKRVNVDQLWKNFETDKPEILGAIFDTLSEAISIMDTISIKEMPRMASSYREMVVIAHVLGINQDEFARIYKDNIDQLNKNCATTPLVDAIREYMNSPLVNGRKAEALVSKIYAGVRNTYSGDKSTLPKSPSKFSQRLKAERNSLEAIGYTVNFDDTKSAGTMISIIKNK